MSRLRTALAKSHCCITELLSPEEDIFSLETVGQGKCEHKFWCGLVVVLPAGEEGNLKRDMYWETTWPGGGGSRLGEENQGWKRVPFYTGMTPNHSLQRAREVAAVSFLSCQLCCKDALVLPAPRSGSAGPAHGSQWLTMTMCWATLCRLSYNFYQHVWAMCFHGARKYRHWSDLIFKVFLWNQCLGSKQCFYKAVI